MASNITHHPLQFTGKKIISWERSPKGQSPVPACKRRYEGLMRNELVAELAKELLGPRGGLHESMHEDPGNEYITGVLGPVAERFAEDTSEIGEAEEIPLQEVAAATAADDNQYEPPEVSAPPLFYPALHPKARPPTMGISFTVQSSGSPSLEVCLTWATYSQETENGETVWKRKPKSAVVKIAEGLTYPIWFDGNGNKSQKGQGEVSLHYTCQQSGVNQYYVSLYLVNELPSQNEQKSRSKSFIFQPQVRILCSDNCRVISASDEAHSPDRGDAEDEEILTLLYSKRPVLARGHLCSAVWKDVDPERSLPKNGQDGSPNMNELSHWVDSQLLDRETAHRFSAPDVRTEFIPVYWTPAPRLEWDLSSGPEPELNCASLAECWDPGELMEALKPLLTGYSKWISGLQRSPSSSDGLPNTMANITTRIVNDCKVALERMRKGLNLLCSNEDARLSFCFANRAMEQQAMWKSKKGFKWRPFQLAFILLTIESVLNTDSEFREVCDLLWVPTGAGKTEAYLAVVAFALAYRRLVAAKRSESENVDTTGAGVAAITRYTLRLLTIQQFRRLLALITACEYLRVQGLSQRHALGWRPKGCKRNDNFIWGASPFLAGLWVGQDVSPNKLEDWSRQASSSGSNNSVYIPGAISILRGREGRGDPAQVLDCPACGGVLAVPEMGLPAGVQTLHLIINFDSAPELEAKVRSLCGQSYRNVKLLNFNLTANANPDYATLTLKIKSQARILPKMVDGFWNDICGKLRAAGLSIDSKQVLCAARASRMGYFIRYYVNRNNERKEYDFEIFCPNPDCPLHEEWCAKLPMGWFTGGVLSSYAPRERQTGLQENQKGYYVHVQEPFRKGSEFFSDRIPIPACTVDDQIYERLPPVITATVDKFARLPYEPRVASFFGNVQHHHVIYGYYRDYQHRGSNGQHPSPSGWQSKRLFADIPRLRPPELVLQDELHLIEGPLGSLTGIYETAIDYLSSQFSQHRPKYIASSATVKNAADQVKCLFVRKLQIFPPYGPAFGERFFVSEKEGHPLDDRGAGRLYVGVCAPRWGALTPLVRIWARLLKTVGDLRSNSDSDIDNFWTLTGYFNAVRELAGARALYRQDIPQRLEALSSSRDIPDDRAVELSSRTSSTDLPSVLGLLGTAYPDAPDALFTTSMFGTGVDISRIGLMVVNGQPKTTSSYIQATGRVGRRNGAVVVTFYRAGRPRDLSHYEYFMGYHRQLHRYVEPVTVYPFAPGVLDRAMGPVIVSLLRNMTDTEVPWDRDDKAQEMSSNRTTGETIEIPVLLEVRANAQPSAHRPSAFYVSGYAKGALDTWHSVAKNFQNLVYTEYAIKGPPAKSVVLGDPQHQHARSPSIGVVFRNSPTSLRDIEETTGFQT